MNGILRLVTLLASAILVLAGAGVSLAQEGLRPGTAVSPGTAEDAEGVESERDPLEPFNRLVFELNHRVLWYTARPIALTWRWVIPEPVRDGFRNSLYNLDSPLIIGNQVLQGDAGAASRTFARMVVNSTVGLGGVVDVARRLGIPRRETDLGLTVGSWGVFEGPYLVLPLLGPTTPRDTFGSFAQGSADPFNLWVQNTDYAFYAFLVRLVLGNIDRYERRLEELDRIEESSIDFYASLRNLYLQKRRADVRKIRADGRLLPAGIHYDLDLEEPEEPDAPDAGGAPAPEAGGSARP